MNDDKPPKEDPLDVLADYMLIFLTIIAGILTYVFAALAH